MKQITTFTEAVQYIIDHIPHNATYSYPGQHGVDRVKYALSLVGNPQEKLRVIHIAGTSGKGSTSYLISLLLHAHGFKTGLYIKPHIRDMRERFQVNHLLLSEEKFITYLNDLIPIFEQVKSSSYGRLTYFEMNSIIAFYIFYKENVDYAVIETGLGGLYDGTNVVENPNKFFVITAIGFDHTQILGDTYKEIATQKAGIIHNSNQGISIHQHPDAERVIKETAKKQKAELDWIMNENIKNVQIAQGKTVKTTFDFSFQNLTLRDLQLDLIGTFQADNAGLALATVKRLSDRDGITINEQSIRDALNSAYLPGRLEIKQIENKTLVIDGAHNPQKMEAFLKNLCLIFPNRKFHFLLSFKKGKDIDKMLEQIIPLAEYITVSVFYSDAQEMIVESEPLETIKKILDSFNFSNYYLENEYKKAIYNALDRTNDILVITGSLYFIGELYPLIESL